MTNKDKFRDTFGVELCYCGIHGKEGCFYIADYDNCGNPGVLITTKQEAKDWLNAECKNPHVDSRAGNQIKHDARHNTDSGRHNTFYEDMPDDFTNAVETIMGYCQNEDCDDDCKNCSNPLSVIRCGDEQGASDDVGTSVADSIRNMDNNTLAIYLHSWQVEDMSVEQIKELLRQPLADDEVVLRRMINFKEDDK